MTKQVSSVSADWAGLLLTALGATDTSFEVRGAPRALEADKRYGFKLEAGSSVEYLVATYSGDDGSGNHRFTNAIRNINQNEPITSDTENFNYESGTGTSFAADTPVSLTNYPILGELIHSVNEILSVGAGGSGDLLIKGVKTVSANTALTAEDEDYLIRVITGDSDKTITLPTIGSGTFNIVIQKVDTGTGKAVVAPSGSETINGETGNYEKLASSGDNAQFVGNGNDWNAISGSLAQPNDIVNIHDEGNERIFTRRNGQTLRLPITVPHPHSISFSGQDNDTEPASDVNAGEIGIYEADGTTQIQNGDINRAGVLYIANFQATYGQDAASPETNLQAEDTQPFLGNIMNGGQVIVSIQRRGETSWVYFVVGSIQRYGTEGYRLNVSASSGSYSTSGTGYSWNVVITPAHPESVHNIVDLDTLGYITQEDIVGKETDRYASYNNALIGSGYRTGDWCLFNQATEPTDDTNAVRQPDIADRNTNGVVVFGQTLRTDRNPNNFVAAPASAATDYKSGDVIYASIWNKPDARIAITLTSGGTLVGTGDAAYIWATATWDEIGEIPASDVVDYGDYFKIAKEEPTQTIIGITKAMRDFLPTRELDDSDEINTDTPILLENFKHTDLGDIVTWHDEHHVGTFTTDGLTYTTNSSPPNNNEVNYIQFAGDTTRGVVSYKYPNTVARDRLKAKIVIGRAFTLKVGNATVVGKIASTPANLFGRLSFNLNEVTESGTRTNGATAEIITESNIPARSQLAPVAFTGKAADVDVDAAGFDGNLSTDDDDLQKVAQKFDDFTAEITAETIDGETEAVESDGDIQLIGSRGGVFPRPARDASADYSDTNDFYGSTSFVVGTTRYVLATKNISRSLFVKKNDGAWVEKTDQLQATNLAGRGMIHSISGSTISIAVNNTSTTDTFVYTFDTSNDTLTYVATRTRNSNSENGGMAFVKNGSDLTVWIGSGSNTNVSVYDTDATFSTLTYNSSKSFVAASIGNKAMEAVGDIVYMHEDNTDSMIAYNRDRTRATSYDFQGGDPNSNNAVETIYADDTHIFINNTTDNKFYAFLWNAPAGLIKKTIPQDEVDLQKKIANTPAAVAADGDVTLIGRKGGNIVPTYDSASDFSPHGTIEFNASCSFVSGGTRYTVLSRQSTRHIFVKKGTGSFTYLTDRLSADNTNPAGMDAVVLSDGTIRIAVADSSDDKIYLYTYNTSDDTLTAVTNVNLQSGNTNPAGLVIVPNGTGYRTYASDSGGTTLYAFTATSTFTTITADSSSNITGTTGAVTGMCRIGEYFYTIDNTSDNGQAYTLAGVRASNFDFDLTSANGQVGSAFSDGEHIFVYDYVDKKFYAYKAFLPIGTVTIPTPQDALKLPVLVYSSASKEIDGTYATVGTDLLADTEGSLIMTFAYDNNGSGQYLPQTVRMLKSRITTTEQRIPVVASVVGGNQSWGIQKSGNNLQVKQYGIASDRSIVDIWQVAT